MSPDRCAHGAPGGPCPFSSGMPSRRDLCAAVCLRILGDVVHSPMGSALTLKQRRFVDIYIATGNATKAARDAGYRGSYGTLPNQTFVLPLSAR